MTAAKRCAAERDASRRDRDVATRDALDWQSEAGRLEEELTSANERTRHAEADSDRWERAHDTLLADWREIDSLPAVHAAFVEGMKLSDAVAAALADIHYAEGGPLFDAEIAKREAETERDAAVTRAERAEAALAVLREAARDWHVGAFGEEPFGTLAQTVAATPADLAARYDETLLRVAEAVRDRCSLAAGEFSPDAASHVLAMYGGDEHGEARMARLVAHAKEKP